MNLNVNLKLKLLVFIFIIVTFFIPLYFYPVSPTNFNYLYINDFYSSIESDISILTFYYLFISCVILFGIMVEFFPSALGLFQKTSKLIDLAVFGSYITSIFFLLIEIIYYNRFLPENSYSITPALYLMIFTAILFLISFFFDFKSNTIRVDNHKKNRVLPYEQLTKLKKLFDDQVLTEEEYNQQKKSLMEK